MSLVLSTALLPGEECKPVSSHPGYLVSNKGRVVSTLRRDEKILKQKLTNNGYKQVGLATKERIHWVSVHSIVAAAFINNTESFPQINHIDGDKTNNCVENLEFCTAKKNMQHAWKTGLCHLSSDKKEKLRIANSKRVRSPEEQHSRLLGKYPNRVVQLDSTTRAIIKKWTFVKEAAEELNLDRKQIALCAKGSIPDVKGYVFAYVTEQYHSKRTK